MPPADYIKSGLEYQRCLEEQRSGALRCFEQVMNR